MVTFEHLFWPYFFILSCYVLISDAVPADYCLTPINLTDCGMAPTPVFAYYKPGSRCEIEYWRGCPSRNRFDNEVTCSFFCIGSIRFENSEENEIQHEDSESCEGVMDTADCGKRPINVYTYDQKNQECVQAAWKGCKTSNKFETEEKCKAKCGENIKDFEEKLQNATSGEIKDAIKAVDTITEGVTEAATEHVEGGTEHAEGGAEHTEAAAEEATTEHHEEEKHELNEDLDNVDQTITA